MVSGLIDHFVTQMQCDTKVLKIAYQVLLLDTKGAFRIKLRCFWAERVHIIIIIKVDDYKHYYQETNLTLSSVGSTRKCKNKKCPKN